MKNIILALLFCFSCVPAWATNYYFSAAGTGTGDGLSAANSSTQANYEGEVSPFNALTTADTVYPVGTITTGIDCNSSGGHTLNGSLATIALMATPIDCKVDGITIEHFTIPDCTSTAIIYSDLAAPTWSVIRYNTINEFGTAGVNNDGIFAGNGWVGEIYGNTVTGGQSDQGTGIDVSGNDGDPQTIAYVYNNKSYNNVGDGFAGSGSEGIDDTVYFYNNIAYGNIKNYWTKECGYFYFWNNYSGDVNVNNSGHAPFYLTSGNPCATDKINVQLRNNIINCGTSPTCYNAIRVSIAHGSLANAILDSDYNIFFKTSVGSTTLTNVDGNRYNFANWKIQTGQDAHSIDADPLVSTYTIGYPTSSSPAINAGTTVATVTDDYRGKSRPFGSAYDIGAYEYTTGTEFNGVNFK